ncbi:MAG: phage terminase large subunit family protein [Clostridiales bacterium]|nr:phage terminase large subunit family protein [Clostridiales bacterium]
MSKIRAAYKTISLFQKIAKIIAPPPVLKISEWADRYRRLSPESSAEPGQWNTGRAPYQKEIMNAVNDNECGEVIIMSSAQVGKTEIILNILGYFIDYDPAPIMVVQPTLEMAQTFSKDRLAPMIRDTPVLKSKVREARSKMSENTILHKKFPGGHITIVGANSAAGLASRPIRILLCDEVDRYPASAGAEGSPVELAEKRTNTFWNRKKIKVSTPTIKNVSKIESEYEKSSMEEWCLPCPCCGEYQPLKWRQIKFEDITMECKYCGERFTEVEWKSGEGKYIAGNNNKKVRGFHLNELASPWKHWDEIINDFKKAKDNSKKMGSQEPLQVWINTALGETWEERGESVNENSILRRREDFDSELPKGVLILTAGVDVQKDRFEIEVVGWGRGYESWGIKYEKLFCDMTKQSAWDTLEEYLQKEYYFADGTGLLAACTFIDTGGLYTTDTYKFLKNMNRKQRNIFGIKGMGGMGLPLLYKSSVNNSEKVKIFILGVDSGKEMIMSRLGIKEPASGYCHFPKSVEKGYDEEYFKGLTSEQRVIKNKKNGGRELIWVKKSNSVRNEPLDIRNYATAAVELLRPNWDILERKINMGINYMRKSGRPMEKKRNGVIKKGISL